MGCGQSAAHDREVQLNYDERMKQLKTVSPTTWDTLLEDIDRLIESIERSKIMDIARQAVVVKDHVNYIRRIGKK